MSSPRLLIATTNQAKFRELIQELECLPVGFVCLAEFPEVPQPLEDGETFEANARAKAMHYAERTGLLTLADDSGLEVDALGGAPGVHSARYAGPGCTDADNNAKLLAALSGIPIRQRSARFRCVLALAEPIRALAATTGVVEGVIADTAAGQNGFGYDPLFFLPDHGITMAQLSQDEKNAISHRGQAARAMREVLVEVFHEDRF